MLVSNATNNGLQIFVEHNKENKIKYEKSLQYYLFQIQIKHNLFSFILYKIVVIVYL